MYSESAADFLVAAWSATSPTPAAAVSAYDVANVLATVTSTDQGFPALPSLLFFLTQDKSRVFKKISKLN